MTLVLTVLARSSSSVRWTLSRGVTLTSNRHHGQSCTLRNLRTLRWIQRTANCSTCHKHNKYSVDNRKKYQTKLKERTLVCLDIVHVIRRLMNKMNQTNGCVLNLLTFFPNKLYFSEDIIFKGRTIVFYVLKKSEHGRSLLTFRLTILWLS